MGALSTRPIELRGASAVVTGGGAGMGRELCEQLCAAGVARVALCDVDDAAMAETARRCRAAAPAAAVSTHRVDVADEAAVAAFRREYEEQHGSVLHLLFLNAGIGTGHGFLDTSRATWDKVFNVNFYGVVHCARHFIPLLPEAGADGAVVVTSSINGLWGCLGPDEPNQPYCTSKFAVRGFTESLMVEMRRRSPRILVSCVHPGHIGTDIALRGMAIDSSTMTDAKVAEAREGLQRVGAVGAAAGKDEVLAAIGAGFRRYAPTSAEAAARVILRGVRARRTRILVGLDARAIDLAVRLSPRGCYGPLGYAFIAAGWAMQQAVREGSRRRRPVILALLALLALRIHRAL